jgi:predicted component of type VI protein secretion system
MKKNVFFVVCLLICCVLLSACTPQQSKSPIKYKRKLETYLPNEEHKLNTIDLSEGPKLKYNANFGPKDLNFDIKIINPY